MRKSTRKDKKRERRNRILMGGFLSLIMIMSGFSIYLSSTQNTNNIKDYGHTFTIDEKNRVYHTKLAGKDMVFYFLPSELERIPYDEMSTEFIKGAKAVALTFNPEEMSELNYQIIDLLRFDFNKNLGKVVISAVTKKSETYSSLPVISCLNATRDYPVINFVESSENKIISNGPCILFEGNKTGFLQLRDKFFYEYYGVYDN